jgi:transcription-repair coupling factor (superfamily II helicase)
LCLQPFWLTSITALYRAFKRYAGFHRYLNRFRTAKQKSRDSKDLAEGKLDIVIGTHQLVNKNVVLKI